MMIVFSQLIITIIKLFFESKTNKKRRGFSVTSNHIDEDTTDGNKDLSNIQNVSTHNPKKQELNTLYLFIEYIFSNHYLASNGFKIPKKIFILFFKKLVLVIKKKVF